MRKIIKYIQTKMPISACTYAAIQLFQAVDQTEGSHQAHFTCDDYSTKHIMYVYTTCAPYKRINACEFSHSYRLGDEWVEPRLVVSARRNYNRPAFLTHRPQKYVAASDFATIFVCSPMLQYVKQ